VFAGASWRLGAPEPRYDCSFAQAGDIEGKDPAFEPPGFIVREHYQPSQASAALNDLAKHPEPIRARVARVLLEVARGSSLDPALARHLVAGEAATPFARALAFETLRHGWSSPALLGHMSARAPKPLISALLRAALTELRFLATPVHAAVAESVAAARALDPGAAGFVNALLRRFLRERSALEAAIESDEQARLDHPRWLLDAFRCDWPDDVDALCAAGNQAGPMWLRVDARSSTRAAYAEELRAIGIESTAPAQPAYALRLAEPVAVERLPGFAQGRVSVQDAAAQHVVEVMALQSGMRVLDACAAPGGKTAALAERVPGLVLRAIEREAARLPRLRETLQRCRVLAEVVQGDAANTANWWNGRPFDHILIDAPCTGTGVIRRHPDIKHLRRPGDVETLVAEQARLLDALWPLLARGGRLTYATCSVLAAENQAQIAAFCQRTPTAQAQPLALPGFRATGAGWQNLSGDGDQDGFFYASLLHSG
jgi:16S rRNA (cytosine967-C5)-methyltransferase